MKILNTVIKGSTITSEIEIEGTKALVVTQCSNITHLKVVLFKSDFTDLTVTVASHLNPKKFHALFLDYLLKVEKYDMILSTIGVYEALNYAGG